MDELEQLAVTVAWTFLSSTLATFLPLLTLTLVRARIPLIPFTLARTHKHHHITTTPLTPFPLALRHHVVQA